MIEKRKYIDAREYERVLLAELGVDDNGLFAPLNARLSRQESGDLDGIVEVTWAGATWRFALEVKSTMSVRKLQDAIKQVRSLATDRGVEPLIGVRFISARVADLAQEERISICDASGNYIIQARDLLAIRLDRKNQYPERGRRIKRVYSSDSSIVGRALLLIKEPMTLTALVDWISRGGVSLSKATVSKVVSGMADDLLVDKAFGIKVLDKPRLLDMLREEYRPPIVRDVLRLRLGGRPEARDQKLEQLLEPNSWVWSGASSAHKWVATAPDSTPIAYAKTSGKSLEVLDEYLDQRFFDCEVRLTNSRFPFFGSEDGWASAVQSYLELSGLDRRERDIAIDLRTRIEAEIA